MRKTKGIMELAEDQDKENRITENLFTLLIHITLYRQSYLSNCFSYKLKTYFIFKNTYNQERGKMNTE
jgi:hypothetical protein